MILINLYILYDYIQYLAQSGVYDFLDNYAMFGQGLASFGQVTGAIGGHSQAKVTNVIGFQ